MVFLGECGAGLGGTQGDQWRRSGALVLIPYHKLSYLYGEAYV